MTGKKVRPSDPLATLAMLVFEAKTDSRVKAAVRDLEMASANDSRSPFGRQLALAVSQLPTTRPETEDDVRAVIGLIRRLEKMLSGRPQSAWNLGQLKIAGFEELARAAALRAVVDEVKEEQRIYCEQTGRKYVPAWKTTEFIAKNIKRYRDMFPKTAKLIGPLDEAKLRKLVNRKAPASE